MILEHILYEFIMYLESRKLWIYYSNKLKAQSNNNSLVLHNNMALECCNLHARNLLDFFLKRYEIAKKTDVFFDDIISDSNKNIEIEYKSMEFERKAINSSISHISLNRLEPNAKDNYAKANDTIYNVLHNSITLFLEELNIFSINHRYIDELSDPGIMQMITYVKNLL
jgi:hypothetical protein